MMARRKATYVACAALVACTTLVPAFGASAGSAVASAPMQHGHPFTPHTPATAVHTDFIVEVNRKGQVTRVKNGKSCPDLAYNAMTYGNALQAFIRTPDGKAVSGFYRLSYDFDPRTKMVHRSVELIHAGGTDPNKLSAVDSMAAIAKKHHGTEPTPIPASPLPDFHSITGHHH